MKHGKVLPGPASVVTQLLNVLLRVIEQERKIRATEDLEGCLAALEDESREGGSARGLQSRVRTLEDRLRKKRTRAPTRVECDDAAFHDRMRNVYSAKLKLYRMSGREDELWQKFSDYDRRVLENDPPEQRALDEDVMRRYEKTNGIGKEKTADYAAKVKAKLSTMVRKKRPD